MSGSQRDATSPREVISDLVHWCDKYGWVCISESLEARLRNALLADCGPVGEVVGHKEIGLALVKWDDNGMRPIGTKVYADRDAAVRFTNSFPESFRPTTTRPSAPSETATPEPVPMFGEPEALLHFLEQAGKGCISGDINEWPQLRPACRWAYEQLSGRSTDTARMDWLEVNQALLNFAHRPWGPHVCLDGDASNEANHFYGKTYREALDAAMKAEKPIREKQ